MSQCMQLKAKIKCIFSSYEVSEVFFGFGGQTLWWLVREQWNTTYSRVSISSPLSAPSFVLYNCVGDSDSRNKIFTE